MTDKQYSRRDICINCGKRMSKEHLKNDMFGFCENCTVEMLMHQLYG